MIIVADQNLPLLDRTFGQHARLRRVPGRNIQRGDLDGADALLVRSITRVDADLLRGGSIRFVGSATIGKDHIDTAWLEENGVHWTHASGCNADAAAQYSLAMILLALDRMGRSVADCTGGIIGEGNVGSRVKKLLESLGMQCLACDPPRAAAGATGLVSMTAALARDIVCVHVPLTRDGPCPTWRMLGSEALAHMPDHALLLNSARGDVVAGNDLLEELRSGRLHAALDVWPGEPDIDPALLAASVVATPHVAGYSTQGRLQGVLMVYQAFCAWAGLNPVITDCPEPPRQSVSLAGTANPVLNAVKLATGIERDDRSLRRIPQGNRLAAQFDALRRNYPERNEFRHWCIQDAGRPDRDVLEALGFQLDQP